MRHTIASNRPFRRVRDVEDPVSRLLPMTGLATRANRRLGLFFLPGSAAAVLAMTEAKRNWIKWIVLALCLSVYTEVCAQPDPADPSPLRTIQVQTPLSGSLAGRLTDLHSAPLAGVQVVLRNQATGATVQAITAKNGAFRFASLDAGEYTLEADAPRLGQGRPRGNYRDRRHGSARAGCHSVPTPGARIA